MTPKESYDLKRMNFLKKAQEYFEFLVSEFGFDEPHHKIFKQPNGTVTRDELVYKGAGQTISVLNAYHPVDYGFEINITDHKRGQTEMISSILKEDQDIDQSYLKNEALLLRDKLR